MKFWSFWMPRIGAAVLLLVVAGCGRRTVPANPGEPPPASPNNPSSPGVPPGPESPTPAPAPAPTPTTPEPGTPPVEPNSMSPHPNSSEPVAPSPSSPNAPGTAPGTPPPAPAPGSSASGNPTENNQELQVLVPAGHAPAWLIDQVQAHGAGKIVVTTYASDDELRSLLAQTSPSYDVVGISDRVISELIKNNRLAKLPRELWAEFPPCDVKFVHHYFDQENAFTYPYGCTLLGYSYPSSTPALKVARASTGSNPKNAAHAVVTLNAGPVGWKDLSKLVPAVTWPTDPSIREACQHFFKEPLETHPIALTNVQVDFIAHLEAEAKHGDSNGHPDALLLGGSADPASLSTSLLGGAGPAPTPNGGPTSPSPLLPPAPSVGGTTIVLPDDGSLIRLYHWALIKDSPHLAAAEGFLRVATAPANAARLATENHLAVTQPAAFKDLAPEVARDPLLYPVEDPKHHRGVLDRCEFIRPKP